MKTHTHTLDFRSMLLSYTKDSTAAGPFQADERSTEILLLSRSVTYAAPRPGLSNSISGPRATWPERRVACMRLRGRSWRRRVLFVRPRPARRAVQLGAHGSHQKRSRLVQEQRAADRISLLLLGLGVSRHAGPSDTARAHHMHGY
jgi:hypothetical protein